MGPVLTHQRELAPSWTLAGHPQNLAWPCLVRADEVVLGAILELSAAMPGVGRERRVEAPLRRSGSCPGCWRVNCPVGDTAEGTKGKRCWAVTSCSLVHRTGVLAAVALSKKCWCCTESWEATAEPC